jgi:fatty-acyl-CoA synthase
MPSQVNALTASYAKGRTDVPLIEQTIGDFFAAMAQRQGA